VYYPGKPFGVVLRNRRGEI